MIGNNINRCIFSIFHRIFQRTVFLTFLSYLYEIICFFLKKISDFCQKPQATILLSFQKSFQKMTNFQQIKEDLSKQEITLVAVSKTKPNEAILNFYNQGQRIFGENKVQELVQKYEVLPKDIQWHLIGHLQTNKVKYAAAFVDTIHSVESLKLLKEINKQAQKHDRVINCFLQMKIAEEATKFGMNLDDVRALLLSDSYTNFKNINITGVMGMATFTDDQAQIRTEFKRLKSVFDLLKSDFFANKSDFQTISMGMSNDYKLAIEEGSNMVRIGSLLFGSRE